jgi:hypothetical protein
MPATQCKRTGLTICPFVSMSRPSSVQEPGPHEGMKSSATDWCRCGACIEPGCTIPYMVQITWVIVRNSGKCLFASSTEIRLRLAASELLATSASRRRVSSAG